MYRRRRRPEPAALFSFDSFLDVVANVIGIVLRLILVAWVGSRMYKGPPLPPLPVPTEVQVTAFVPPPEDDSRGRNLQRHEQELSQTRQGTLAAQRAWEASQREREQAESQVTALRQQREKLEREQPDYAATLTAQQQAAAKSTQALAQARERNDRLKKEIETLQKSPRATKALDYRLPLSSTVQTEELFFELKNHRVTVIDLAGMLDEVQLKMRDKVEKLKTVWQVEDTTAPLGAFRLKYVVERRREFLENGAPNRDGGFRYGPSAWKLEPVQDERGETLEQALRPASAFRKVVDKLDTRQVVVTLWVYPDSFGLYREIRNHLHDRDFVVAGRPLPEGVLIASSRDGSRSRGQ